MHDFQVQFSLYLANVLMLTYNRKPKTRDVHYATFGDF